MPGIVRCVVIGVPDRGVRAGVLLPFTDNVEVGVAIVGDNERQRVSGLEVVIFVLVLERGGRVYLYSAVGTPYSRLRGSCVEQLIVSRRLTLCDKRQMLALHRGVPCDLEFQTQPNKNSCYKPRPIKKYPHDLGISNFILAT
jgi:hypothetical protein